MSARRSIRRPSSISVADHQIVGRVKQASPFCPEYRRDAGRQAGLVHAQGHRQDAGVRRAAAVRRCSKTLDTGPITNHVNFARNANGTFAYVTIGGLNEVKVFRTDDFSRSRQSRSASCRMASGRRATARGSMSGWRTPTQLAAIDTLTNKVIATIPIGQAPQALAYVPNAVPEGDGTQSLQPLGVAGQAAHLFLASADRRQAGTGKRADQRVAVRSRA